MKIIRFGIGAATCIMLGSCANLLPLDLTLQGCYPVDTLSASQRTALHVEDGNPIFLFGGEKFVCPCYRESSLVGTDEQGSLTGAGEEGNLSGGVEEGHLAGADEKGQLSGTGEKGHLAGAGEQEGSLAGAGEEGHLAGNGEEGRLAGADEKGQLSGTGEKGHLAGAGEQEGSLAGAGEEGRLAGDFAKLSCRIVPGCSGFQLVGYEPKQIMVLTATGQEPVATNCVTW